MAQIEVILPKMGESVAEATITTWLKSEGDTVEAEEAIVEIATDKVDSEVPSPAEGTILKILVQEGEVAKVGQAIAIIGGAGDAPTPSAPAAVESKAPAPVATPVPEAVETIEANMSQAVVTAAPVSKDFASSDRFYSPLVKSIAKTEGIAVEELDQLSGSGKDGRVTKKDILSYVEGRQNGSAPAAAPAQAPTAHPAATPAPVAPATSMSGDVEVIEMDRMRKLIADHMVRSKQTSAHVTSFVEADVTNLVNWRNKHKNAFEQREGEKLTFTPIFIDAIVRAIKDFPMINISIEGDKIIRKKNINVGMAAALPSGNLIVPVIKNADRLNLLGITKAVNDLAKRARENKLMPDEISGGTYTVSNVGTFGNVFGTPIINQPQVAIMAVGAITKKPAVIETPSGDTIGIRQFMFLSHSYDHRVVDGALGGMFVRRVADYLEQWDMDREI
ncbi:MAG: 2-oxo acid dehydrogenase subunit E2 [Flavobacteriales bacterium]|nr:2-oxo acid dehydrogenase subunit E2 [Flavobacteriales bacterium]